MRWPDEIRDPSAVDPPTAELTYEEIDGAPALIDRMTHDDLTGDDLRDTYTEALQIIEAKREEEPLPEVEEPEQPAKVLGSDGGAQRVRRSGQGGPQRGRRRARATEEEGRASQEVERGEEGRGEEDAGAPAADCLVVLPTEVGDRARLVGGTDCWPCRSPALPAPLPSFMG
ncbi:hypothetical protein [Streptomyces sp. NPDC001980]|uniref:hypothetical protein n=1 Tax=Streptomyces sp. NPDC001980 TaxID=3157126 RepID=UPI003327554C